MSVLAPLGRERRNASGRHALRRSALGELGAGVAKLLNPVFEKIIRQDIMNFKEYIETKHNAGGMSNVSTASNNTSMSSVNTAGDGLENNNQYINR